MKIRNMVAGLVFLLSASVSFGQWVPVTVNTDTGEFKPLSPPTDTLAVTNGAMVYGPSNRVYLLNRKIMVQFDTNKVGNAYSNTNLPAGTVVQSGTNVFVGTNVADAVSQIVTTVASSVSSGTLSNWSQRPAVSDLNMSNYGIQNVSKLAVTGRLVIGFGIFTNAAQVPAPASSNIWYVYCVSTNNTNYLQGVDCKTNRTWIGAKP